MPENASDLPLRTKHDAVFALPCAVARGVAYLSDPTVVLAALPSVERVIHRQRDTYRVTLAPVTIPGVSLRPAAEVAFATGPDRVTIESVPETPHDLQPGEVATRIAGLFILSPTRSGCAVRASLRIAADVPIRILPPLMPRLIAHRTAEAVLALRMKQEIAAMTRALVHGFAAWDGSEIAVRGSD